MVDWCVLCDGIGTGRCVQSQCHDSRRALLDQQIVARGLVGKADRRTNREPLDRSRTIGTEAMAQDTGGVGGVRIDITEATRVATCQGIIVELDKGILSHHRGVIIDRDHQLASSTIAIRVSH